MFVTDLLSILIPWNKSLNKQSQRWGCFIFILCTLYKISYNSRNLFLCDSEMFQEFLLQLSKVSVALNGRIEEDGDSIINTMIFGKNFSGDVFEYKKKYFTKLRRKELRLLQIQARVYREFLTDNERKILLLEIENRLLKLEFLRYIYNTEAQKIDDSVQVYYPYSIEIYNKAFFGVTKKNIWENITLKPSRVYENIYTKRQIQNLVSKAQEYCPEMQFKFWKYPWFSHRAWVLRIPNQKLYNLQNIIVLFFHETTHFFRTLNGTRNLGFPFQFSGYSTLEEWIALYNEYLYWNKICNYGAYIPYYNLCMQVLLMDIWENEKKQKVFEILSHKWFSRERSDQYFIRFYKYCQLWGTHLFLKDLIYHNGYKNVKKLIRQDPKNYEKIMAWDIWIQELSQWLLAPENNYKHKLFFQKMLKEIMIIQK